MDAIKGRSARNPERTRAGRRRGCAAQAIESTCLLEHERANGNGWCGTHTETAAHARAHVMSCRTNAWRTTDVTTPWHQMRSRTHYIRDDWSRPSAGWTWRSGAGV